MNKKILAAGIFSLLFSSMAFADDVKEKNKLLLGKQQIEMNYHSASYLIPFLSNSDITVESSADWVDAKIDGKRIRVNVDMNLTPEERVATVSVVSADGTMTRKLVVTQGREGMAIDIPTDSKVKIASAKASVSQPGEGVERTYDGDPNTLWHSPYSGSKDDFPITLTYNFNEVDKIDYLRYVPRPSGGNNGNFDSVQVFTKCAGETEYVKAYEGKWNGASTSTDVTFPDGLKNPVSIQFKVFSGASGEAGKVFASCAEMEFYQNSDKNDPNLSVFANETWDSLKEGVEQSDIDAMTNPYCKFVAQSLLNDKEGFTKGRVQNYTCRLHPNTLSSLLNAPGKYYDNLQGVTGININKGIHGIAVSGLPDGASVQLKVVAWFSQELNSEGNGGGPREFVYTLRNGINSINYDFDYDGLAYIAYYSNEYPVDHEKYPDIKVHFINGNVNGYLSPDRTNEELEVVLKNAKNRCIDLVGSKVHSVWQVNGLLNSCKDMTGTKPGYVQYMNILDSLVDWEHELLGLKKYDRVPDNRTMAYVNYTYYMFQGSYGVSFKYDTEPTVLNCKTITKNNGDAIWGMSHEWGHQHQMTPYFCWTGLSESSNNMNSCENVLRMGYHDSWHAGRIKGAWNTAYTYLIQGETTQSNDLAYIYVGQGNGYLRKIGDKEYEEVGAGNGAYVREKPATGKGQVPEARLRAYESLGRYSWCKEIQDLARSQYDLLKDANGVMRLPSVAEDSLHAISTHDLYVEANTAAYYMLHNYFSFIAKGTADYKPDYQKDLYEALRRNDDPVKGSDIEPGKTGLDKYELLAQAQANNRNNAYDKFVSTYPQSVWTTRHYLVKGSDWTQNSVPFIFNYVRKASRICGYNLFHYFDKMGFFREAVMCIDDYGLKDYAMTKEMREEFRQDMEALGLPMLGDDKIEIITHAELPVYETPNFPNEPKK